MKSHTRPIQRVSAAKRNAIIRFSTECFLTHGYKSTSIERIAKIAQVSKVTIYRHFGDKNALFRASISMKCEEIAEVFDVDDCLDTDPSLALAKIGQRISLFFSRSDIIQFERRIAAETDQNPELGHAFLNHGPRRTVRLLAELLREWHTKGKLEVSDPSLAAEQFISMCRGHSDIDLRFGISQDVQSDAKRVQSAVDVFCKAYRTRKFPVA